MKKLLGIVAVCCILVTSQFSCSGDDDSTKDSIKNIDGTWIYCPSCLGEGFLSAKIYSFNLKEQTFKYYEIVNLLNPTSGDLIKVQKTTFEGTFKLGQTSLIDDGTEENYATEIDLTFSNITLLPLSDEGAQFLNGKHPEFTGGGAYLEISDWTNGVAKSINGLSGFPEVGSSFYELFLINQDSITLFLSNKSSGEIINPDNRPKAIDTSIGYLHTQEGSNIYNLIFN